MWIWVTCSRIEIYGKKGNSGTGKKKTKLSNSVDGCGSKLDTTKE